MLLFKFSIYVDVSHPYVVAYNFVIVNSHTSAAINDAVISDGLPLATTRESFVRTIQFFLVAESGTLPTWLNFSSKVGALSEQGITPRQTQVKKSRRGPQPRRS